MCHRVRTSFGNWQLRRLVWWAPEGRSETELQSEIERAVWSYEKEKTVAAYGSGHKFRTFIRGVQVGIHHSDGLYILHDFSNLIRLLHDTLCDVDLIYFGVTLRLMCADWQLNEPQAAVYINMRHHQCAILAFNQSKLQKQWGIKLSSIILAFMSTEKRMKERRKKMCTRSRLGKKGGVGVPISHREWFMQIY